MNMFETAKLVFMCSLFFEGIETEYDGIQPNNDVAILEKITIYETGWFENPDQGEVEIVSYITDKLYPQTKWYVDYEYKTTYTVSEGGNYYFETAYYKTEEDEDTLEITETKGRIEHAIDPETLKYRSTFYSIKDDVEDEESFNDFGYCVPVYEKED